MLEMERLGELKRQKQILHFNDINQSHEVMGFSGRTDLADFHVYTLEETYPSTRKMMPPYTFRFYCLVLLENSEDARLELDAEPIAKPSDSISFQSPGHVSAWVRGEAQRGFILYFQPEFLSHYSSPLAEEFPFFRPLAQSVLPLLPQEKAILRAHFEQLVRTFKRPHAYRVPMLQAFLSALLFDCKGLYENYNARLEIAPQKSSLATRFQQLVEQHFLVRQSVQAYAELLNITPNYLSQTVSDTLGRKAHEVIADRLLVEAKKLLRYSDLSVAQIADYLGFEEPTHFGRFFKRKLKLTPLEYRRLLPYD